MERGLAAIKRYRKDRSAGKIPVVDSTMMDDIPGNSPIEAVVDSTTLNSGNGGNPPIGFMVKWPHHIATTMGSSRASAVAKQSDEVES